MNCDDEPYSIAEILSMERRTVEINKLIKSRGRPTPNISLTQESKSRTSSYTRKFQSSSYDKWDWLCGCSVKNVLYCFPCVVSGGDGVWARTGFQTISRMKEKCQQHEKSKEHMQSCVSFQMLGKVDIRTCLSNAYAQSIEQHNELVDKNRRILADILKCLIFCCSNELPLRGNDEKESSENRGVFFETVKLVATKDPELKNHIKEGGGRGSTTYLSSTSQVELLDCCYSTYQSQIKKEIQEAKFISIMADETTDVSQITQLVIVFRYLVDNEVKERFWGFFQPKSTDAPGISEVLLNELEKVVDHPDKVIGQTFDGAAVMRGDKNGVKVKVQSIYKFAYYVHCYAHQLNLILKSSAKSKSSARFFRQLTAISNYFSRSPKKVKVLAEYISKTIPTASATRWNFTSKVVKTVKENYDGIVSCLQEIGVNLNDTSAIDSDILLQYMLSDSFKFWLSFYYPVYNQVSILFNQLQSRQADISVIKKYIDQFQTELNKIKDNYIHSSDTDCNRAKEITEIIGFIDEDLTSRLSFKGHLMAESLFHNKKYSDFDKQFPNQTLNMVVQTYPFLNEIALRAELEVIYSRNEFREYEGLLKFRKCLLDNNLHQTFGEAFKLISLLLTIPMTTVDPERQFSTLKRIKTDLRNKMGEESLNAHTAISGNKAFFENTTTQDKIINMFAVAKNRRMELIKK